MVLIFNVKDMKHSMHEAVIEPMTSTTVCPYIDIAGYTLFTHCVFFENSIRSDIDIELNNCLYIGIWIRFS